MNFTNTKVMNFDGAFKSLHASLNGLYNSDSFYWIGEEIPKEADDVIYKWVNLESPQLNEQSEQFYFLFNKYQEWLFNTSSFSTELEHFFIGPKDLTFAQEAIRLSDNNFLKWIIVSIDITAPIYFWKETDLYKSGIVTTTNNILNKPITKDSFEIYDIAWDLPVFNMEPYRHDDLISDIWVDIIHTCETLRKRYNESKDERYWKELIRILPEGFLQTKTWIGNYGVLRNIFSQRKDSHMTEWKAFCGWIKKLPYASELITFDLDK